MAAAAQARVDEEIDKQIRSLCDLRTHRNTFSFISRLATETLETIFICSARDYHDTHDGSPTAPGWVNVSYVCRHWRNVAVNSPTLWSYLFITSPRWTDELLARSKKASLKINAGTYTRVGVEQWFRFVGQVMDHMERMQELRLVLPNEGPEGRLFPIHLSRAPRLQNVNLSFSLRDKPSQPRVPLFDGDTTALRTLELSFCPEPWYLFKLTGLTTLKLHYILREFQQSMMEFLTTLSAMQGLTHLYLCDALASAAGVLSSAEFHTFQKINLRCLSRLLIAAPFSTVIAFLACVNIPIKTGVMLDCRFETGFALHDYASLFSVLAQRSSTTSQALSSPTFRSLIIESARYGQGGLTFSLLERDYDSFDLALREDWRCNSPLKIKVCLGSSTMNNDLDTVLNDVSSFVTLTDVQSIHAINPPTSPASWMSILGHFRDLRYLKLSSGDLPDLASVLSFTDRPVSEGTRGQNQSSDRGPDRMLAPALEELELYRISFRKGLKKDKNKQLVDLQALCNALATRKESSGRLTVTRCTECKVTARWTKETCLNMIGHWKKGRFRVVERDEDTSE